MKKKFPKPLKIFVCVLLLMLVSVLCCAFHPAVLYVCSETVMVCVRELLPRQGIALADFSPYILTDKEAAATTDVTEKTAETTSERFEKNIEESFTETPNDILKLIAEKKRLSKNDEKAGAIKEKQYKSEGVTDSFGRVRVKNVNETDIDIEKKLKEKIDLRVTEDKPSVLIFHTHTTETFQLLDRGFYEKGFMTRSHDSAVNMVRVGQAICSEIEKAGYMVIHDKEIHDYSYNGAYAHSRARVEKYLKQYPDIDIVLDVHRDAISLADGTKIKPTAEIMGKKAAQIMLISGCQEEGNGITNLPDWQYNLTFAVHFQDKLEELFPGITRPLYFCPRSYNMNLTHCSLLVEVGSDSNTLEEAVFTGSCIGRALCEILEEYEE